MMQLGSIKGHRSKGVKRPYGAKVLREAAPLLILATPLWLVGCSAWFPDQTLKYLDAKREAPLVMPAELDSGALQDDYPVPRVERQRSLSRTGEVPPPPEAEVDVLAQEYSIRRSDEQVWLVVGEEPGRVWPALNRFWTSQGVDVSATTAKSGLMQASLAGTSARARELLEQLGLNTNGEYQFQVKLDQGLKRRTSEIAVRVVESAGDSASLEQGWAKADAQPALEEKLLEQIQAFMMQDEANRSYSLLAQDISGGAKVTLHEDSEPPYLQFNLSFERAWNAVGQALAEGKVQIVDLNRSEGIYLLNFQRDGEAGGGFFGWFSDDETADADRYNFRLRFEQVGDAIQVRAEAVESDTKVKRQIELLNRILENIA